MRHSSSKQAATLLLLLAGLIACFYLTYLYYDHKAQRYNEIYGTNYTALDMAFGFDKPMRDIRW